MIWEMKPVLGLDLRFWCGGPIRDFYKAVGYLAVVLFPMKPAEAILIDCFSGLCRFP